MEQTKNELQLVSNMIMCGDHPSITKTELNARDTRDTRDTKDSNHKDGDKERERKKEKEKEREREKEREKEKDKERDVHKFISYGRISPTSSRTHTYTHPRTVSEQALRALEARRRARSLDLAELAERDVDLQGNRALVQAAMGSFRWPPYLLCVWVLVLVLTHALHCLVAVLQRALPALRKVCQYFRAWTEARWRAGAVGEGGRACALALAAGTGALYSLLAALGALHAAAVWAVEPLYGDLDALQPNEVPTVINYDEINSKVNLNAKQ